MNLPNLPLLIILFLSFLPSATYSFTYHIKGHIRGIENQMVYLTEMGGLYYLKESEVILDSVLSLDGTFEFTGEIESPILGGIRLPDVTKQSKSFMLEEGEIRLDGHIDSLYKSVVKGGRENEMYKEGVKIGRTDIPRANALVDSMAALEKESEKRKKFRAEYDSIRNKRISEELKFVKENNNSIVSVLMLHRRLEDVGIGLISEYFDHFEPDLQNSTYGQLLARRLKVIGQMKIGKASPFFISRDMQGREVTSDQYKGKFTVIDFWATWCVPCLEKMPELHEINKKYGERINLVSISIDRNTSLWKKIVEQEKMDWENLCDGLGSRSAVAIDFNISFIPRLLVLDEDGILVYDSDGAEISVGQFLEENMEMI